MLVRDAAQISMNLAPDFTERFNKFLYKRHIRKLGSDIESAREWCLDLIRREHPHLTEEQRETFYHNLIAVRFTAVDEWTQRMS
jgi:hypothetical protein